MNINIVHIKTGHKNSYVTFDGDEAMEPCHIVNVEGDFSLSDIQALFWLSTSTSVGTGLGICEMKDDICSPAEFLAVMKLNAITVDDVPGIWSDALDTMYADDEGRFADDDVS